MPTWLIVLICVASVLLYAFMGLTTVRIANWFEDSEQQEKENLEGGGMVLTCLFIWPIIVVLGSIFLIVDSDWLQNYIRPHRSKRLKKERRLAKVAKSLEEAGTQVDEYRQHAALAKAMDRSDEEKIFTDAANRLQKDIEDRKNAVQ